MRRITLLLALVCVVATGCGGSGRQSRPTAANASPRVGAAQLTLRLRGATKASVSACGATHRTALYRRGQRIIIAGSVAPIPAGRFSVHIKLKLCRGGVYVPAGELRAVVHKHNGSFAARLPPLMKGAYFVRASLLVGSRRTTRSEKRHFEIG